jgi:hypothetical protein
MGDAAEQEVLDASPAMRPHDHKICMARRLRNAMGRITMLDPRCNNRIDGSQGCSGFVHELAGMLFHLSRPIIELGFRRPMTAGDGRDHVQEGQLNRLSEPMGTQPGAQPERILMPLNGQQDTSNVSRIVSDQQGRARGMQDHPVRDAA